MGTKQPQVEIGVTCVVLSRGIIIIVPYAALPKWAFTKKNNQQTLTQIRVGLYRKKTQSTDVGHTTLRTPVLVLTFLPKS